MLASALTHWEELGILAVSILTIIGFLWRGVAKPLLKLIAQGESNDSRLERIEKQFEKNAGSTLRDAVDRVERRQDETHRRQEEQARRLDRIETKLQ